MNVEKVCKKAKRGLRCSLHTRSLVKGARTGYKVLHWVGKGVSGCEGFMHSAVGCHWEHRNRMVTSLIY